MLRCIIFINSEVILNGNCPESQSLINQEEAAAPGVVVLTFKGGEKCLMGNL
jgi:hypothetical protein